MPKLSVGQKAARVTQFLVGLRKRRVAAALARCGFAKDDLEEGWMLLSGLTSGRLDVIASDGDPQLVDELDAWENEWFPVADASLRSRFPDAHKLIFNNLTQTEGLEVITSVGTFHARLDRLPKPQAEGGLGKLGAEARKLLVKRGITDEAAKSARTILKKLGQLEEVEEPDGLDEQEDTKREAALWNWYLEWSQIARVKIKDRRALRSLGFLKPDGTRAEDPTDEGDTEAPGPVVTDGPPAPTPTP